jgi:hypothetical protein
MRRKWPAGAGRWAIEPAAPEIEQFDQHGRLERDGLVMDRLRAGVRLRELSQKQQRDRLQEACLPRLPELAELLEARRRLAHPLDDRGVLELLPGAQAARVGQLG